MNTDTYFTISNTAEGFFKDRSSKFFAYAIPVSTEAEVKSQIEFYKKKYYDARHHCYAYIIGPKSDNFRANDDGEPSNTAGKPILAQIQALQLTNTMVIVVRYFGGTLLGTGGLINAYREAAKDVLTNVTIIEQTIEVRLSFIFNYELQDQVMRIVKDFNLKILESKYNNNCELVVLVPQSKEEIVLAKFNNVIRGY